MQGNGFWMGDCQSAFQVRSYQLPMYQLGFHNFWSMTLELYSMGFRYMTKVPGVNVNTSASEQSQNQSVSVSMCVGHTICSLVWCLGGKPPSQTYKQGISAKFLWYWPLQFIEFSHFYFFFHLGSSLILGSWPFPLPCGMSVSFHSKINTFPWQSIPGRVLGGASSSFEGYASPLDPFAWQP